MRRYLRILLRWLPTVKSLCQHGGILNPFHLFVIVSLVENGLRKESLCDANLLKLHLLICLKNFSLLFAKFASSSSGSYYFRPPLKGTAIPLHWTTANFLKAAAREYRNFRSHRLVLLPQVFHRLRVNQGMLY